MNSEMDSKNIGIIKMNISQICSVVHKLLEFVCVFMNHLSDSIVGLNRA